MDGWGGEEVRDGTLVSGLGKWTENGQSCQRVHSFTHSFTDLSHTHTYTHTHIRSHTHTPPPHTHTHCSPAGSRRETFHS